MALILTTPDLTAQSHHHTIRQGAGGPKSVFGTARSRIIVNREARSAYFPMHACTHWMKFSVESPVRSAIVWPWPQTVSKSTWIPSL